VRPPGVARADIRERAFTARVFAWVVGLALASLAPAGAAAQVTFSATLAGAEETPPNESTATGTAAATLGSDGTLSYSVNSTGFATPFRAAHVHHGGPGVAGPILFAIECSPAGTSCTGVSPPLGAAERTALLAGNTYFNLHTDAYPGGEIRGQLVPAGPTSMLDAIVVATLVGQEAMPPNSSTATGTAAATLNADGTLTYSVNSTGFATPFQAGRVHQGGLAVAGPAIFAIECRPAGTTCTGTTPPLTTDQRAALLAGDTYVNLSTDAFPDGEIRGQLVTAGLVPTVLGAQVEEFSGRVRNLGETGGSGSSSRGADLTLSSRLKLTVGADLPLSSIVLEAILSEAGGRGELVKRTTGEAALPIVLRLARYHAKRREATYRSARDGIDPRCQVRITPRGRQTVDLALTCKRNAGAMIPLPPAFCGDGPRAATKLVTRLVVNTGAVVVVSTSQPWECVRSQGRIRELRSTANRKRPRDEESPKGAANRPPTANFSVSPRRGTSPLHVSFTNRSTDPDGHVTRFGWTFGDGAGSTEEHPSHTYAHPGEFVATLVVTDDRGLASPVRRETIRVDRAPGNDTPPDGEPPAPADGNRPPRPDFRVSVRSGAAPLAVTFTNRSSDPDGDALTFSWDFGDGTQSTERDPVHTYARGGRFVATLTATDARGAHADRPKQDTITVTGTAGGASPGGTNRPPQADFRVSVRSGVAPLAVSFTNRSTDPDGDALVSSWDFGDGTRTSAEHPTHTYTHAGKFIVTLIVTDTRGARTERAKQETITVAGNRAPAADFRAEPRRGRVPLTVRFQNRSADPDSQPVTSAWDFGDGTLATEHSPTHTYTRAGTFVVTLMVSDASGAAAARPKQDTIEVYAGGDAGVCGDGTVDQGEECDPPNGVTCDGRCRIARCGDHFVQLPIEECDPPNGTTCDATCQLIEVRCGDGVVEPPEECEEAADCGPNARCTAQCACECVGARFTSTFAALQRVIFDSPAYQCSSASCHAGSFPSGDLDLTAGRSYVELVGVPSGASAFDRIERGDPETSFLYLKLAAKTLGQPLGGGQGAPMPQAPRPPLTAAHLEAIRLWILDGAPAQGVVAGTAGLLGVCLPEP
jgi:PKD repeat protein